MIGSTIARMNVLIGATDNATSTLNGIINKIGKLAVAAGALTGVAMIGKKSIDAAAEFNKVLTDSLVMFDDVSDAMRNKMAKAARELSTQIPRSANDIANAYYYLGSAGLDAATALKSLNTVGQFAVATNLSMADAAQTAATVLKTYNIPVSELSHYLDMMTTGMKNALMTQEDMNEALSYVGGTAKSFGIDLKEVISSLAIFADAGIKGSMAGTSLRRLMINLLAPTGDAKDAIEELGLQIYDENGKFRGLTTIITELIPKLQSMTEEQRNHYIEALAGARALSGFNAIVSKGAEHFVELTKKIEESDGTINKMADDVKKQAAAKFQMFKNRINDLAISLGEVLLPAVESFLNVLTPVISFLKEHKEIVVALTGLIGGLAAAYITWKAATLAITIAQSAATAAQWLFNAALFACPLTWIVVAIMAVVAAVWLLVTHWKEVAGALKAVWDAIVSAFQWLVKLFITRIQEFVSFVTAVWDALKGAWDAAVKFFINLIINLISFWMNLGKAIGDAVHGIIDWFIKLPSMIWNSIKDIGTWLVDAGKKLIGGLWRGIKSAIGNFGKWLYDHTVGAATRWLGISSPSKRFMEIGKMVSLGFQRGMESVNLVIPSPEIGGLPSIAAGGSTFSPVAVERKAVASSKNITVRVEPITVNANITSDTDVETLIQKIELAVQGGLLKGVTTGFD